VTTIISIIVDSVNNYVLAMLLIFFNDELTKGFFMKKTKQFLRCVCICAATVASLTLISACTSVPTIGDSANVLVRANAPDKINWPEKYKPENATFAVSNAIAIKAPPQVWDIIVQAETWPS
jgi:hypothetical protein